MSSTDSDTQISFEYFPPRTDAARAKLAQTTKELGALGPEYFSVTFGAGGSTQKGTLETVLEIKRSGYPAAPHISCIGTTRQDVATMLRDYQDHGIDRIVALRGDLPSGAGLRAHGDFAFANELVEFVRTEFGDSFFIEVAAYPETHPQAANPRTDIENFKRKVDAGANAAITQYFFNADAYCRFVDDCRALGVDIPIVPGIMPITNYTQLARFSDACGAEIPRWIRRRLAAFADDTQSLRAFGLDVVSELCERLMREGVPGFHFYTLNRAGATTELVKRLGLDRKNSA